MQTKEIRIYAFLDDSHNKNGKINQKSKNLKYRKKIIDYNICYRNKQLMMGREKMKLVFIYLLMQIKIFLNIIF